MYWIDQRGNYYEGARLNGFRAVPKRPGPDYKWQEINGIEQWVHVPVINYTKQLGDMFVGFLAQYDSILNDYHRSAIGQLYSTINYNLRQMEDGNIPTSLGKALIFAAINTVEFPEAITPAKQMIINSINARFPN